MLIAGVALLLALPTLAKAQDINLAAGGADQIWKGTEPGARAGVWLDQGAVSGTDSRRDLIVGAPGNATIPGAVYLIFGGAVHHGELLLSSAESEIISSEAGNLFGFTTAAGNIRNTEGSSPRNLLVGAPGALGGRGAVYLFNGGFTTGSSFTDGNAVMRILGRPGDQLGFALATGDLDNDGFREIIAGAPGTNRVYIIRGAPTLSGTIDLAVVSPHRTINAAGIGSVLAAGDITNDNIADLIVGSPSNNLFFTYTGQTGAVPADAAGAYFGIDAGDGTGTTIQITDLDGDGRRDLVVAAPTADGPGNSRADGGEVYLFYGPVAVTGGHSVAEANVIFFGAAAGYHLGGEISAGDINRDTPNDLVLFAPGNAGGAGRATIYYGRSRATTGVISGTSRVVDFAAPGQASRHIIGDLSIGAITTAQVFEVTGEGARDVIVTVAGADANSGKLFFTISPKLRISPSTLSFFVQEGKTGNAPTVINVTNPSTVPIGWQGTSNRPWLGTSATTGFVDHTHSAQLTVVGNAAGMAPGAVQTGRIQVASTSRDLEMSLPVDVTMTVLATRLAIDLPANGSTVNGAVTIAGWAVDLASATGTGVNAVDVFAFPSSGAPARYVGRTAYGAPRSDIGGLFGPRFQNSGFSLRTTSLGTGTYQIVVVARSTVSNTWANTAAVTVNVINASPTPLPTPPPDAAPTPGAGGPGPGPGTRISTNRTALYFGSVGNLVTPGQPVMVNFSNGTASWTATTTASWLELLSASGTGAGTFNARIRAGTYSPGLALTGSITIAAPGVSNSPLTIPVTFRTFAAGGNPAGVIDTPQNGVSGVVGALPFTGWAVDDVEVRRVTVWRDTIPAEGTGEVFIGTATFVDGARPDVEAANPTPLSFKAGWGLLILTNMLPNEGNGTFRLHAYAEDAEGHRIRLGSRVVTCTNATATKPFGTIDTPDQGGSASGSNYINFGWVLAPQPNFIPTDGSTIMVFIDGVPVGRPTYNQHRQDIATLFPGRKNTNGAVGFLPIDTTRLANGVHTIAWGVTDNVGHAEGLGSRFFTVFNGAAASTLTVAADASVQTLSTGTAEVRESAAALGSDAGQSVGAVAALPESETPSYVRTGFDPGAPLTIVDPDTDGARRVVTTELDRLEITVGAPVTGADDGYEGYVVAGGTLKPLPSGSFLDRRTGEFFWQTGVGYVGPYDLLFVRTEAGVKQRIPVSVMIHPRKGQNERLIESRPIR